MLYNYVVKYSEPSGVKKALLDLANDLSDEDEKKLVIDIANNCDRDFDAIDSMGFFVWHGTINSSVEVPYLNIKSFGLEIDAYAVV